LRPASAELQDHAVFCFVAAGTMVVDDLDDFVEERRPVLATRSLDALTYRCAIGRVAGLKDRFKSQGGGVVTEGSSRQGLAPAFPSIFTLCSSGRRNTTRSCPAIGVQHRRIRRKQRHATRLRDVRRPRG
jgi:hypothetical protein